MSHSDLLTDVERDVVDGKPVADILRKCLLLGSRLHSTDLREWASRELKGYEGEADLPQYRAVPAVLCIDGLTMTALISGQQISPGVLPDFAQKHIREEVELRNGVGEIEALIAQAKREDGFLRLGPPRSADLVRYMNADSGNTGQQITRLYWRVSSAALESAVDHVRTALTELVAELRAGTPDDQELPPSEIASQAVNVAVRGIGARAHVTTAQAAGSGSANVATLPETSGGFWTPWRRAGAFIVGLATVAAAIVAILEFHP